MEQTSLTSAWSRILPQGVFASFGTLEVDTTPLSVNEQLSLGTVNADRMHEFSIGRMHAKCALNKMGVYDADIPRSKQTGAPIWPVGVIGSVTHVNEANVSHAAAVVARTDHFNLLGIDAESNTKIHPSIWHQFLTEQDFDLLASVPTAEKNVLVSIFWSLKESSIKATGQGDMVSWSVSMQSVSNEFKLIHADKKLELEGMAIIEKNLVLSIVYRLR